MKITAELSLYPLSDAPIPTIEAFIRPLLKEDGLDVRVNQMSTQIEGDFELVYSTVGRVLERSFHEFGTQILVAKFINRPLGIGEPVDIA